MRLHKEKLMNIILTAINAKYIHSSLAAYSLYEYLSDDEKQHVKIMEFTINQQEDLIVSELLRTKPDVLAFSCYIWNIDLIMSIIETFKKIMPHLPIILGGPEVSYDSEPDSQGKCTGIKNEAYSLLADIIVKGEGEDAFKEIVAQFINRKTNKFFLSSPSSYPSQEGLCPTEMNGGGKEAIEPQNTQPLSLDSIPFVYTNRLPSLNNRIIYYETSRGCVNSCGFCLSSATKGVRFLSQQRIESDLNKFLTEKVKQVKFVDRTFNCNRSHALFIWEFLIKNDNGITNFHFEIAGELLSSDMLKLLNTARKGLFQFEIGVQSTNPKTLAAISRKTNTEKLFKNVNTLMSFGNIHLHLDLIVGLPHECYISFQKSFNDVFALRPHKLQIGFLKLLKGSQLHKDAERYGIVYKKNAPYNVLKTDFITFDEINNIHKIEHMVETFYGSKGFNASVKLLLCSFNSPFTLFDSLASHWEQCGYHLVSHKKMAMYSFLHSFVLQFLPDKVHQICELLKFDMLLQENIRSFPSWVTEYYQPDNKLITRTVGVHTFAYDILSWLEHPLPSVPQKNERKECLEPLRKEVTITFDYAIDLDKGRAKSL